MNQGRPQSSWSRRGRTFGCVILALTVFATAGWAAFAPLSGAIVASGRFVVLGERQKIQHRDGGRIAKLHVALGDRVTSGQVVVTFDTKELRLKRAQIVESRAAQQKKLSLIKDELVGVRKLYRQELVAKPRLMVLERERVGLESDTEEARLKLEEIDVQLANAELRSPTSGRVVELAFNTPTGVVRSGEKILELVPDDARLVIEARIEPHQVDDVRIGAGVEVRLSGLNQKTTPALRGHVTYVSADALVDERSGGRYFQARVEVDDIDAASERFKLVAGMPAETMFETGNRTVLEYVLKPLGDIVSRSMREPL